MSVPTIEWRWPWEKREAAPVRPPKVGGTRAPAKIETIDFNKPHDFHFQFGYQKTVIQVFTQCKLVGFTTPMTDDPPSPQWEEYQHNRWIVLERPDGRRIYLPRDNLIYIEDSHPATPPGDHELPAHSAALVERD